MAYITHSGSRINKIYFVADKELAYDGGNVIYRLSDTLVSECVGVTFSGTRKASSLGKYSIKITPKSGYTWADGTSDATTIYWYIIDYITNSDGVRITSFTDSKSYTFNNSTITRATIANFNGLSASGTLSAIDVGTYTATLTPKTYYRWAGGSADPQTITWSITPLNITITFPDSLTGTPYTTIYHVKYPSTERHKVYDNLPDYSIPESLLPTWDYATLGERNMDSDDILGLVYIEYLTDVFGYATTYQQRSTTLSDMYYRVCINTAATNYTITTNSDTAHGFSATRTRFIKNIVDPVNFTLSLNTYEIIVGDVGSLTAFNNSFNIAWASNSANPEIVAPDVTYQYKLAGQQTWQNSLLDVVVPTWPYPGTRGLSVRCIANSNTDNLPYSITINNSALPTDITTAWIVFKPESATITYNNGSEDIPTHFIPSNSSITICPTGNLLESDTCLPWMPTGNIKLKNVLGGTEFTDENNILDRDMSNVYQEATSLTYALHTLDTAFKNNIRPVLNRDGTARITEEIMIAETSDTSEMDYYANTTQDIQLNIQYRPYSVDIHDKFNNNLSISDIRYYNEYTIPESIINNYSIPEYYVFHGFQDTNGVLVWDALGNPSEEGIGTYWTTLDDNLVWSYAPNSILNYSRNDENGATIHLTLKPRLELQSTMFVYYKTDTEAQPSWHRIKVYIYTESGWKQFSADVYTNLYNSDGEWRINS